VNTLKAPFPYFGGKSRASSLIWERLGDVDNYIEPFFGSGANLLARPHEPKVETVNDIDSMIANFWRATQTDPEAVAKLANAPVNEADMHARHRWLMFSCYSKEFRESMKTDPDYFDVKIAAWWCWGMCCWIGSGWCAHPEWSGRINAISGERGINRLLSDTHRPQLADTYSRGRGVHGNDDAGTCEQRERWLIDWFSALRDRLRAVRVCCGDWSRVCGSFSTTTRLGLTGIFFDPPYGDAADRDMSLYAHDSGTVAADVLAYCLEHGDDPMFRIVLAGYEGEGHNVLESKGWTSVAWKGGGGYGNRTAKGKENSAKERLWCSPHCINPEVESMPLFAGLAES
jgi:DNA adenine methylase